MTGQARRRLQVSGLLGIVVGVSACTLEHPLPAAPLAVVQSGGALADDGNGDLSGTGAAAAGGLGSGGAGLDAIGSGGGPVLGGQGGALP